MFTRARAIVTWTVAVSATIGAASRIVATQTAAQPVNDAPNPYRTVQNWAQLPEGRK